MIYFPSYISPCKDHQCQVKKMSDSLSSGAPLFWCRGWKHIDGNTSAHWAQYQKTWNKVHKVVFLKVRQISANDWYFIIWWWQWPWLCQVYSLAVMITRKPDFEPIPDPSPTQSQKHHSLLYAYGGSYKYTNIQNIIQSHCTSGIPGASAHWPLSIHPSRCSGIQTS